jgi:hypothetical protein
MRRLPAMGEPNLNIIINKSIFGKYAKENPTRHIFWINEFSFYTI